MLIVILFLLNHSESQLNYSHFCCPFHTMATGITFQSVHPWFIEWKLYLNENFGRVYNKWVRFFFSMSYQFTRISEHTSYIIEKKNCALCVHQQINTGQRKKLVCLIDFIGITNVFFFFSSLVGYLSLDTACALRTHVDCGIWTQKIDLKHLEKKNWSTDLYAN